MYGPAMRWGDGKVTHGSEVMRSLLFCYITPNLVFNDLSLPFYRLTLTNEQGVAEVLTRLGEGRARVKQRANNISWKDFSSVAMNS